MEPVSGRRWSAALVAGALILGGVATGAGAQEAPAPEREPVEPPADNVFPVPLPHEVSFADSWHACRDGCDRKHKGNDLMADEGVPAVAVEAGTIAKVDGTDDGNGGLSVWLLGDSGAAYYYAHNSQNLVAEGQRVARGQMIARVGRTGNARTTPPHIHFQINVCGELSSTEPCAVDPHPYLSTWAQAQIDGGADGVGWYQASTGAFGQRTEAGSPLPAFPVGAPGATDALPVAGDWDGDGRDSVGVYRRSDGTFQLHDDEGAALTPLAFGEPGRTDVWPISGDFDGDGRDTVGLYRQAEAHFVVLVDVGVESAPVALGTPGRPDALPVVGDWDGDGRDALGVYNQGDAVLLQLDDGGEPIDPTTVGTPSPETFALAGDWDGDGRDTIGLLRRDAGVFDLPVPTVDDPLGVRNVPLEGGADALPVAGDWNGRDLVTLDELRQIYGTIPDEAKVVEGMSALNAAMAQAGISTPARKAAFLATLRSESGFRFDAVEVGNDDTYRGRGFIQLTGDGNYRAAGDFLDLDLIEDPDLAIDGMVSPAIAAWYWTVARNINVAADELDMAAVNIAIGFAPSERRDMLRCSDFLAALRYYSGGEVPDGVNCKRTPRSRLLAFAPSLPIVSRPGRTAPSGTVTPPPAPAPTAPPIPSAPAAPAAPSAPTSPAAPRRGTPAPADPLTVPAGAPDPAAPTAPPSSATTAVLHTTAPPAPTTQPPRAMSTSTTSWSTTSSTGSSTTSTGSTTTLPIDPDRTTTTTLLSRTTV